MLYRARVLAFPIALLACLSNGPAFGQSAVKPLSVDDILEMEVASDPQLSPDSKRVAYVRGFVDATADQRRSNIWIVGTDGAGERSLTTGNFSDSSPRWAPDGQSLAYISDRDGTPQIYRYWIDTAQSVKLTHLTAPPSALSWSPDGKSIAFVSLVTETPRTIAGMPKPPAGATWAPPPQITDRLVYRFNGPGYLKPGRTHLFAIPSSGGTPRQISSGDFDHGGVGLAAERSGTPQWALDGKSIYIAVNRRTDADLNLLDSEIVEYSVADGAIKTLTDRRGPDNAPVISPDGKWLAYTGFDDRYQGYQVTRLYVMAPDGANRRELAAELDRDVRAPRFSADSRGIFFLAADHGDTGLYFVRLEGGQPKRIASGVAAGMNAGGGGPGIDVRGKFIATMVGSSGRPGEVAVVDAKGVVKVLSDVNGDVLGARTLGEVEEVRYRSSKDGREIQGWLIKPPGFDPAKKYPLVLEIHGGPFADYGPRFDIEKQLLAARGYLVLYTNPRGSTSYGEAFGNLIHHAYPGDDLYDLLSGVDAIVARGYVDTKSLFITGGSGGGVLTCWVIGHDQRFAAAATLYPVINWASFMLTADIGNYASKYWFGNFPWDAPDAYWQRSLLSVIPNVKTPTLVMVGDEDWRTPPSEAEQYYQALKLRGVESEFMRVPGEPHGITRRPSHHMAKVLAIVDWFERHRQR